MAGAMGTIVCTACGTPIPVVLHRQPADDLPKWVALVSVDMAPIQAHMQDCTAELSPLEAPPVAPPVALRPPETRPLTVPRADLTGRIHQLLRVHGFVDAKGSRACTMCGTKGVDCFAGLRASKAACCPVCAEGNTHPNPGGDKACATWAADRAQAAS